ncbi:hypothetical protein HMPREF9607_00652 [Cutibacterium modestum HL044PA1]|uniref:Uncharacterized protein n=1 Tax=Cutibacterium modestum HL044PA1 TaxID=765109 RepID=A0ABN0C7M8_9ACTN|nr:hypothetical protein HMPREF9607_00652 [Cutibacterium modestum HL044PA1]
MTDRGYTSIVTTSLILWGTSSLSCTAHPRSGLAREGPAGKVLDGDGSRQAS